MANTMSNGIKISVPDFSKISIRVVVQFAAY